MVAPQWRHFGTILMAAWWRISMAYDVGQFVWIPCEVKPGPFPDERIARIRSEQGEWVGFVPVHSLRDPVFEGSTFVRAIITRLAGGTFRARISGESVTSSMFEGTLSRVEPIAAVQA
jgi:hypothetical protein